MAENASQPVEDNRAGLVKTKPQIRDSMDNPFELMAQSTPLPITEAKIPKSMDTDFDVKAKSTSLPITGAIITKEDLILYRKYGFSCETLNEKQKQEKHRAEWMCDMDDIAGLVKPKPKKGSMDNPFDVMAESTPWPITGAKIPKSMDTDFDEILNEDQIGEQKKHGAEWMCDTLRKSSVTSIDSGYDSKRNTRSFSCETMEQLLEDESEVTAATQT